MDKKSKDYVDKSKSAVQCVIRDLQQSLETMENHRNKDTIEAAIEYLDSACQELYEFKD